MFIDIESEFEKKLQEVEKAVEKIFSKYDDDTQDTENKNMGDIKTEDSYVKSNSEVEDIKSQKIKTEKEELLSEKEKLETEKEKQEAERLHKVEFMKWEESSLKAAERMLLFDAISDHLVYFLKEKGLYSDFCSRLSMTSRDEKLSSREYKTYYTYYFDGELFVSDINKDKEKPKYMCTIESKLGLKYEELIGEWFIRNENISLKKIIALLVEKYDINVYELYEYCVSYYYNQRKYEKLRSFTWRLEELGIEASAIQDESVLYTYKDVVSNGDEFVKEVRELDKRKYKKIFNLYLQLQENEDLKNINNAHLLAN